MTEIDLQQESIAILKIVLDKENPAGIGGPREIMAWGLLSYAGDQSGACSEPLSGPDVRPAGVEVGSTLNIGWRTDRYAIGLAFPIIDGDPILGCLATAQQ